MAKNVFEEFGDLAQQQEDKAAATQSAADFIAQISRGSSGAASGGTVAKPGKMVKTTSGRAKKGYREILEKNARGSKKKTAARGGQIPVVGTEKNLAKRGTTGARLGDTALEFNPGGADPLVAMRNKLNSVQAAVDHAAKFAPEAAFNDLHTGITGVLADAAHHLAQAQALHNEGRMRAHDDTSTKASRENVLRDAVSGSRIAPMITDTLHKKVTGTAKPEWLNTQPSSAEEHLRHAGYHVDFASKYLDKVVNHLKANGVHFPKEVGSNIKVGDVIDPSAADSSGAKIAGEYASGLSASKSVDNQKMGGIVGSLQSAGVKLNVRGLPKGADDLSEPSVEDRVRYGEAKLAARQKRVAYNDKMFEPLTTNPVAAKLFPGSEIRGRQSDINRAKLRQQEIEEQLEANRNRGVKPAPVGSVVGVRPNEAEMARLELKEKQRREAALATPEGQQWLARQAAAYKPTNNTPKYQAGGEPTPSTENLKMLEQRKNLVERQTKRFKKTGSYELELSGKDEALINESRLRAAYKVAADPSASPQLKKQVREAAGLTQAINFDKPHHQEMARKFGVTIPAPAEPSAKGAEPANRAIATPPVESRMGSSKDVPVQPDIPAPTLPAAVAESLKSSAQMRRERKRS